MLAKLNGTPYKNVKHVFRKACKAAGLIGTGVSLHTLRHTFASNLVMAGVDLVTVQTIWRLVALVLGAALRELEPAPQNQGD